MMTESLARHVAGLRPRDSLGDADLGEMYELLSRHFEGVEREQFERDLAEKNWVIEVRRNGQLLGFSTLIVCEIEFENEALTVIYSGDTIVSPHAWGSPALARTWIAAVNYLRGTAPVRRCYWLLLTSGFRTYRFLPVFWKIFYPRHDEITPIEHQRLLEHLAELRYGDLYNRATGIVRFLKPQRLCGSLGELPESRTQNLDVAFFLARNPGHGQGDELACLTEIHEANLTPAGRRMIAGQAA